MAWVPRQILNRRFQSGMNTEDGFLTGYFFVWYTVPGKVYDVYKDLFGNDTEENKRLAPGDAGDMGRVLGALTTGVPTIPDTTINQTSLPGMGGTKWGVTTNIDTPSTVSFKFRELSGLPVIKTICSWFSLIRDPNSGVSRLLGEEYTKSNFSGSATLAYVKPDGITVELATRFEGIYPLKYPTDLLVCDVGSVDALEADIEFHADSVWSDADALERAQNIVTEYFNPAKPFHEPGKNTLFGQMGF